MDWDYLDENYTSGNKVRSLDEILKECEEKGEISEDVEKTYSQADQLQKVVNDVKNVRELIIQALPVKEIANRLSLDEEYVTNIAITINGSPEDNSDIAIAHMVMMN